MFSEEFYAVAKKHLTPDGILQVFWIPEGGSSMQASVVRALTNNFPYVRVYRSVEHSGWHFLASMHPIPARSAADLVARMPDRPVADMMEWGPAKTPKQQFERMLSTDMTTVQMINLSPTTPALQDDWPINEYFLLRVLASERLQSGSR